MSTTQVGAGWQAGHQYEVRPPILLVSSPLPQRGHSGSGLERCEASQVERFGIAPTFTEARSTRCRLRPSSRRSESWRSPKRRAGWTMARQSTSSDNVLPRPAMTCWSISTDFERAAATSQPLLQKPGTQAERIDSLLADHRSDADLVIGQPKPAQFSLVPKHDSATPEADDDPIEPETLLVRKVPDQAARHAKVEQKGRALRGRQQPLPAPFRFTKSTPYQPLHEVLGRPAPDHARISNLDRCDLHTDCVVVEQATETLHVGQLRHLSNLSFDAYHPSRPEHLGIAPARSVNFGSLLAGSWC